MLCSMRKQRSPIALHDRPQLAAMTRLPEATGSWNSRFVRFLVALPYATLSTLARTLQSTTGQHYSGSTLCGSSLACSPMPSSTR